MREERADEPRALSLAELIALSTPQHLVARLAPDRSVYAAGGARWLCAPPGAVQSGMHDAAPGIPLLLNHRGMALAAALPDRTDHVLDLGSGCGALLAFARGLPGLITLTGVESDADMLLAARQHFALPADQPVVMEDALAFLMRGGGGVFDLVFCDVFEGVVEPAWLGTTVFYEHLARRLGTDGAAAINMLPTADGPLKHRLSLARGHFAGVGLAGVAGQGNVVMYLSKRPLPEVHLWTARLRTRGIDRRVDATLLEALRIVS